MKQEELLARQCQILTHLSSLPKKMLSIHDKDNVTEFVLHELCHEKCFNLNKAAYIVNNPAFDCVKGVAGHCHDQAMKEENIWDNSDTFTSHMQSSPFNQQIRSFQERCIKPDAQSQKECIERFALKHGFKNHHYTTWNMKHDNQGFFVYETANDNDELVNNHLDDSLCLLSFCPIF